MAKFDPPRLSIGGLSGRVYVTTHGKILGVDDRGRELIQSSVKYDVTEQFDALAVERVCAYPYCYCPGTPEEGCEKLRPGRSLHRERADA